jgi:hypothetical protein
LDGEILEVTEVEDMEQEIMDTDEYKLHLDITIRKYKDPKSSTNQTTERVRLGKFLQFQQCYRILKVRMI